MPDVRTFPMRPARSTFPDTPEMSDDECLVRLVAFWLTLYQRCRGFTLLPRQRWLDPTGPPKGQSKGPSMSGFSIARQKMVDGQVRPSDVTDLRIIDAMLAVPREAFVPQDKQALAYLDIDLDVSEGGSERRFLIKPVVTAKMLQAA